MRTRFSQLAGLVAIAIGAAACQEPPPPEPKLIAEPSAVEIDKTSTEHKLQVDGHGNPSALEKRRLSAFIADTAGNRPESLHATISGSRPAEQLRGIARLLVADGVVESKITIVPGKGTGPSSTVTIAFDRYTAAVPTCPAWSTGEVATNDNSTRANLGCTNLANFAAMIADPHDLVAGSSSRYGDGTTAAAGVQRYHEDKVKQLPKLQEQQFKVGGSQ